MEQFLITSGLQRSLILTISKHSMKNKWIFSSNLYIWILIIIIIIIIIIIRKLNYHITIIDTIKIYELSIIDWITIHFGKNPMNGGRPPRQRNIFMNRDQTVCVNYVIRSVQKQWLIPHKILSEDWGNWRTEFFT